MTPTCVIYSIRRTSTTCLQMRSNSTTATAPKKIPQTLPRLPVPDLPKTLNRYLSSLEPLLLEDESRGGAPYHSAHALRTKWANEFESGVGKLCQKRLLALDRASPYNWLDDNFWISKAYLEWRGPLLINSNWWLAFNEDDQIPEEVLQGHSKEDKTGITPWQVRRAAWLVHRMLVFKGRLATKELHPETTRTGIWLRESSAKMFNIARIPHLYCDVISTAPHPTDPSAQKLFLMIHGWCYTITVYRPASPSSAHQEPQLQLIPAKEIEYSIRAIVFDAERRLQKGERAVNIGVLSADTRDKWAENLQHLLSLSPTNRTTHRAILHSLMGLSLDNTVHSIHPPSPSASSSPTQQALDTHLHTIRSTPSNIPNRFFDKAFTVIVDPSARAGAMGEHSPCDALVPSIVAEWGVVEGVDAAMFDNPEPRFTHLEGVQDITGNEQVESKGWERLDWVVDDEIRRECAEAHERARKIIENSDDSVLWFTDYGTDWMKGVAKFSPDAYIQMVLQLAWYKTRGEFTATYETALTRMFKNGRTETIRTLTRDSRAFVLAMVDPKTSPATRYTHLRRAIQTHTTLTREAATGRGIDRHLLGLRLMLRPLNGERAELFEDELFERSSRWKLSTSGLSAGHLFRGTGFGAAYEDGYGINYLAAPDIVKFGIESKFSSQLTSTEGLKAAIIEALHEIRAACSVDVIGAHDVTSHL